MYVCTVSAKQWQIKFDLGPQRLKDCLRCLNEQLVGYADGSHFSVMIWRPQIKDS